MPYKRSNRKPTRRPKNMLAKDTTNSARTRELRFKQINQYKIKPEPFPRVMYTRMKYALYDGWTSAGTSTASSRTFRLNSIFDPYYATGGSTVTGHANIAAIYGSYLVTGAKVEVKFYDPSTDGLRVGCRLRINAGGATTGKSITQLAEQPMTYMAGLSNSGKQTKKFSYFVRPWSLMGLSKLEYMANSSMYSSSINSSPSVDNCLFDVFSVDAGAAIAVNYTIRITYYVQLYDRIYVNST